MPIPLAFMDASVIEEVPLELWRETFDAIGWLTSLQEKRASFTYDELLEAIERGLVDTRKNGETTTYTLAVGYDV